MVGIAVHLRGFPFIFFIGKYKKWIKKNGQPAGPLPGRLAEQPSKASQQKAAGVGHAEGRVPESERWGLEQPLRPAAALNRALRLPCQGLRRGLRPPLLNLLEVGPLRWASSPLAGRTLALPTENRSSLLLFLLSVPVTVGSIPSILGILVFILLIGRRWRWTLRSCGLVCLRSVAFPVLLCGALLALIVVHRGLVFGLPAARCSSSRAGAMDVSHGLSSGSSISVNLPSCRSGRGRWNWFSGTEPCVRWAGLPT
jgi:hypothetical protein